MSNGTNRSVYSDDIRAAKAAVQAGNIDNAAMTVQSNNIDNAKAAANSGNAGNSGSDRQTRRRIHMLDTIRGVIILGVVAYHFLFDLWDIWGMDLWWMESVLVNAIRDFGAGVLIFLSGISSLLSHSNIARGVKTIACALILSLVTYFVVPDNFIFWGILHFLGFMMLFYGITGRCINKLPRLAGFGIFMALFVFMYPLTIDGYVGLLGLIKIYIPEAVKTSVFTYIIGFGGGELVSADYFPILPWSALFLAGTYVGNYVKEGRIPEFMYKDICRPVTFLGRNTLIIYLLHQPVIFALVWFVYKIFA